MAAGVFKGNSKPWWPVLLARAETAFEGVLLTGLRCRLNSCYGGLNRMSRRSTNPSGSSTALCCSCGVLRYDRRVVSVRVSVLGGRK